MEGDKSKVDTSSRSGAPLNSRWNPTKEQISMLESFYSQGIRTPTAEQIQHITARLKAYGQIEGKNVFYWFQNHKARQRQKQKQENLAYINRHYLHNTQPIFPAPCPNGNVACSPYCLPPQTELGYYPQYQKLLPPGGLRRRPRTEKMEKMKSVCTATGYQPAQRGYEYDAMSMYPSGRCLDVPMINTSSSSTLSNNCQETLPLFPLLPTGVLQGKADACSTSLGPGSLESSDTSMEEKPGGQTFYDFFSGHGSCESE